MRFISAIKNISVLTVVYNEKFDVYLKLDKLGGIMSINGNESEQWSISQEAITHNGWETTEDLKNPRQFSDIVGLLNDGKVISRVDKEDIHIFMEKETGRLKCIKPIYSVDGTDKTYDVFPYSFDGEDVNFDGWIEVKPWERIKI